MVTETVYADICEDCTDQESIALGVGPNKAAGRSCSSGTQPYQRNMKETRRDMRGVLNVKVRNGGTKEYSSSEHFPCKWR